MPSSMWLLGLGSLFTLLSLALIAVSFATDNWVEVTVQRSAGGLSTESGYYSDSRYFTRNRGLFRICYQGNETKFLDGRNDVIEGNCLWEKGYELSRDEATVGWSSEYNLRIHLMRTHFGFFCMSMLFLVVGAMVGVAGCWRMKVFILQLSGLLVFIGAFFAAGGMAFFHGYDYLERQKISDNGDFRRYIELNLSNLFANSRYDYGYSYILAWVGVGLATIGAIMFLVASYMVSSDIRKQKRAERKEKSMKPSDYNPYNTGFPGYYPYGYGNAGYMDDTYKTNNYAQSYYTTSAYPAITY